MKFISDNLNDFTFHDAVLEFVSFKENTLIVTAKALNINKNTKQNTNDYDAEIESALITFEKFGLLHWSFYEHTKQIQKENYILMTLKLYITTKLQKMF